MSRPSSKDPLDKFRWKVEVEGFTRSGFTSVEVPGVSFNTKEYAEGGDHLHPRQIIESASYRPITLLRGATDDRSFIEWAKGPIQVTGAYSNTSSKQGDNSIFFDGNYRRSVTISHLGRDGKAVRVYKLYNAIPVEFQPASDFSADGDDTVSLEKLVLKYESFEVRTIGEDNNPFSIKDITKRLIRNF